MTYGCPYALQAIVALNTLMHFAMRYPRQNAVVFKVEDAPQLRIVSTELAEAVDTLIEAIDKAIQRFTRAIAKGGDLDSLVEALKDQETRKQEILAILFSLEAPTAKPAEIRQQLEGYLTNWRGLLRSNVIQGQQALRRLIDGRLEMTPAEVDYRLDELERGLFFLVRDPEGRVNWAFPFSAEETPHQVDLGQERPTWGA